MARKGPLKRKLRTLSERQAQERRDLGAAVLQMYRADELNPAAIEAAGEQLKQTAAEIAETEGALGLDSATAADQAETPTAEKAAEAEPVEADGDSPATPALEPPTEVRPTPPPPPPPKPEPEAAAPPEAVEPEPEPAPEAEAPAPQPPPARAPEADERSAAAMIALERDLERAQERAGQALEALRDQLEQAQARAEDAEERARLQQAENRTAAAQWLRGQAEAMRREAERQVREELAASTTPGSPPAEPAAPRPSKSSAAAEAALAEMTERSNEANARAQEAERRLSETTAEAEERGRREAERRLSKELRAREEELQQERQAKARALEAAEKRLSEIEAHVAEAERRAAAAEGAEAGAAAPSPGQSGRNNLNLATFDQLRELGLSPTQANRVIAYRERLGGYKAVDDLRQVPGLPDALVADLRERLET